MKTYLKQIVGFVLWIVLGIVVLYAGYLSFLCLRYSPSFMVNEYFKDLGSVYDYRILPEHKLTASPDPFHFGSDGTREGSVQVAFQSNPAIPNLEDFLENTGTQAFLVIQDDTIIYERNFLGQDRSSIVTSFSTVKSFNSALVGIAISEGLIASAEDPITTYLPELLDRDPRFADITIRHLLTMSSGLRYTEDRKFLPEDDNLTYMFDDLRHLALTETEVVAAPGVEFVYNNYNPLLLGLILERVTGMPVTTYLQDKLWTPLGMEYDGSWSLDSEKSDFEKMESGLNARAIDFAKLGRLYLNDGNWNGNQIVPAEWVELSTSDNGLIQDPTIFYGYMWWGNRCTPGSQNFLAMGNFGQFIYVSPARNLIIVRNGEQYGLEGEFAQWAAIFCQFTQDLP